jgi:hypothetical protein
MGNTLAVAALALAALFGLAACGTGGDTTSAARASAAPKDNTSVARESRISRPERAGSPR